MWKTQLFFHRKGRLPSNLRSCYCLLYLWNKAHSSPSNHRSETMWDASPVNFQSPWWWGRHRTYSPRRSAGTSCFSSEHQPPNLPRRETTAGAPVAGEAVGDLGVATAVGVVAVFARVRSSPGTGNHCTVWVVSPPGSRRSPPTNWGYWWTRHFPPALVWQMAPARMCSKRLVRRPPAEAEARCTIGAGKVARNPGRCQPSGAAVFLPYLKANYSWLNAAYIHLKNRPCSWSKKRKEKKKDRSTALLELPESLVGSTDKRRGN